MQLRKSWFCYVLETGYYYVTQSGLKLLGLISLPASSRYVPLCPTKVNQFSIFRLDYTCTQVGVCKSPCIKIICFRSWKYKDLWIIAQMYRILTTFKPCP